jgi:hypothetical protein
MSYLQEIRDRSCRKPLAKRPAAACSDPADPLGRSVGITRWDDRGQTPQRNRVILPQVVAGGLPMESVHTLFLSGLALIRGMRTVVAFAHGDFDMGETAE